MLILDYLINVYRGSKDGNGISIKLFHDPSYSGWVLRGWVRKTHASASIVAGNYQLHLGAWRKGS